ncbi:MAG: electron transporter RnfC, partial [Bacteroidota bacterium]
MKTFKPGGVHPPENKLSKNAVIKNIPVPDQVIIPLSQHLGVPANPLVKKGDEVLTGQLIAKGDGFISANIHSSVSGKVIKIDSISEASGYRKKSVFIKTEGDQWVKEADLSDDLKKECYLEPSEIIKKVSDSGIVGLGGATFP